MSEIWIKNMQADKFDSSHSSLSSGLICLISGMEREIKSIKLQLNLAGIELEFKRN